MKRQAGTGRFRMVEAVRALVRASAAIGANADLHGALRDADSHADPLAVEEMVLQSYLFVGYPRALQAMQAWRNVSGRTAPAEAARDRAQWRERGERVCARVYGGAYRRLRANVSALHPDLEQWMVVEGYGKVLGRPGLELAVRELCIIALLVPQDAPAQLHSHLRGALNAGAAPADVAETLDLAGALATVEQRAAAVGCWEEVCRRRAERAEG
jgi:4-carboxymuconolactone decarboxylase